MKHNYLPLSILTIILIVIILRLFARPRYAMRPVTHCKAYFDADYGVAPKVDHSPTFSTRMNNDEWAEAVLWELIRKANR